VIVSPAARIGDVATRRCPFTATASPPAAHRALTMSWRSTSWTDSDSRSVSVLRLPVAAGQADLQPRPDIAVVPAHICMSRKAVARRPSGRQAAPGADDVGPQAHELPAQAVDLTLAGVDQLHQPGPAGLGPPLGLLDPAGGHQREEPTSASTAASDARICTLSSSAPPPRNQANAGRPHERSFGGTP